MAKRENRDQERLCSLGVNKKMEGCLIQESHGNREEGPREKESAKGKMTNWLLKKRQRRS